jgi:hypothetical protein
MQPTLPLCTTNAAFAAFANECSKMGGFVLCNSLALPK